MQSASPRGLLDINTFIIPRTIIADTIAFLREVGSAGAEGFVLWSGSIDNEKTFRFSTPVFPEQRPLRTPSGLMVFVDGDALFSVNKLLYERREILGGQVHTHPTSAYHSATDDHFPLVTLLGALSVVLPDFAQHAPNDMSAWAWYRLREYGRWAELGRDTKLVFI